MRKITRGGESNRTRKRKSIAAGVLFLVGVGVMRNRQYENETISRYVNYLFEPVFCAGDDTHCTPLPEYREPPSSLYVSNFILQDQYFEEQCRIHHQRNIFSDDPSKRWDGPVSGIGCKEIGETISYEKKLSFYNNASFWWTEDERSRIRRAFLYHNRESVYKLLLPKQLEGSKETPPKTDHVLQWGDEFDFIKEHGRKRHAQGYYEFHELSGVEGMEDRDQMRLLVDSAWGNKNKTDRSFYTREMMEPRLISEHDICQAFQHARDIANFSTPHVLIAHMNENWGALSSEIVNRTSDWGDIVENWRDGYKESEFDDDDDLDAKSLCDPLEVVELYLNSPYTLAVFTTQHQSLFDHDKVHSVPIGVASGLEAAQKVLIRLKEQKERYEKLETFKGAGYRNYSDLDHDLKEHHDLFMRVKMTGRLEEWNTAAWIRSDWIDPRPFLLMINASPSPTRQPQIEAIIRNFNESGYHLRNTYDRSNYQPQHYYEEMSRSKFVLCPSGMGFDSYRIWEALAMGAIPVIEHHRYYYITIRYNGGKRKILRTIPNGEEPIAYRKRMLKEDSVKRHLHNTNATLEIYEIFDGWRKALDGLPVVWIDGSFGDRPPLKSLDKKSKRKELMRKKYYVKNYAYMQHGEDPYRSCGGDYLTPEYLEQQYDALSIRAKSFRYEKLTSLYWIRLIEIYLLLPIQKDSDILYGPDGKIFAKATAYMFVRYRSRWDRAMKSLRETFNNHTKDGPKELDESVVRDRSWIGLSAAKRLEVLQKQAAIAT